MILTTVSNDHGPESENYPQSNETSPNKELDSSFVANRDTASAFSTPQPLPESPKARFRSTTLISRIAFGRSKGIRDAALGDQERSRSTEETELSRPRRNAESQERKVSRQKEKEERRVLKQTSKEQARQEKQAKVKRKAEEKKFKDYYGIRGFDPNAGVHRSLSTALVQENVMKDSLSTGPKSRQHWGVEYGRPL
jgi:hypothetical protein